MTNKTYKAGDIVHVRLDEYLADLVNRGYSIGIQPYIIAHHPAPEPVVRWVNVYDDNMLVGWPRDTFELANVWGDNDRKRTCVLRLEWPDGDTSKKPIVTVEDV